MVKKLAFVVAIATLLTGGLAEAQAQTGFGLGPGQRRANMEAQLMRNVVQRISDELGLDEAGRARLLQLFQEGEEERRALAREGAELHERLRRALADSNTPDSEFNAIVQGLADLRQRELALWREEHEELREFLTPRQQAQFIALRNRFTRAVQNAVQQRRPPFPPR